MEKQNDPAKKFLDEIFDELKDFRFTTIKKVNVSGNSGAVAVPKEFVGRTARIIVLNKPKEKFTQIQMFEPKDKKKGVSDKKV
jgi:putative transposon-encoded protein